MSSLEFWGFFFHVFGFFHKYPCCHLPNTLINFGDTFSGCKNMKSMLIISTLALITGCSGFALKPPLPSPSTSITPPFADSTKAFGRALPCRGRGGVPSKTYLNLFGGKKSKDSQPGGGGPMAGMGNMMEQMKKAQEIAKKTQDLQASLGKLEITGSSGGVTVVMTGQQKPVSVTLPDDIGGGEELSRDVERAIGQAQEKSMENMGREMQKLYGELGLPGAAP
ncbi:hypothetical protein TrRE_jg10323 [Triparma retinervis]|uniref:Nucleoid-associated protein n=1 Tax=Triparma retinervis TaxID=2557542 RepID=A0A9W7DZP8_9STRA|nr:hypothetical protein TrRE_jg10323 [Triparma retinervis]